MSDLAPMAPPGAAPDRTRITAAVRAAWNAALGTRAKDPDKSIIDMNVGAGRVTRLLDAIEAATGMALPITIVFQAPTCAALTDIVLSGKVPSPEPLVVLKPGDASPPLFIVPGIGATVFELFDMGKKITCPGVVYAVQPHGPDGLPPNRTIPTQADFVASILRTRLPQGPYRLMGYSFGGLVALEAARRLRATGGNVEFIGLLDTTAPEPFWSTRTRLEFLLKRLRLHARELKGKGFAAVAAHLFGHLAPMLRRLRRMGGGGGAEDISKSPFHMAGLPPALGEVRDINIAAFNAYKMAFYDSRVTLFRSADGDPLSCDPLRIWPHWVRDLDVRHVPGAHETMMRGRHAGVLATAISAALAALG
ncbi:MAG TPA: thioesterase domain-containing protein [Acetobacteraceae bacterium]|nr:thioesterase domain-containing protein [Acetobacteraceae bacterium]